MERRAFREHLVARHTIEAARGRENQARHAGSLRQARETHRPEMVNVVCALGIHVAERVVRQSGKMNDGVESPEVGYLDVAQVHSQRIDRGIILAESAALEQECVESYHVMPRGLNEGSENRPYVSIMTRYQDTHLCLAWQGVFSPARANQMTAPIEENRIHFAP
jgi:hypothetical protein